jgi:hypothetical protein
MTTKRRTPAALQPAKSRFTRSGSGSEVMPVPTFCAMSAKRKLPW